MIPANTGALPSVTLYKVGAIDFLFMNDICCEINRIEFKKIITCVQHKIQPDWGTPLKNEHKI